MALLSFSENKGPSIWDLKYRHWKTTHLTTERLYVISEIPKLLKATHLLLTFVMTFQPFQPFQLSILESKVNNLLSAFPDFKIFHPHTPSSVSTKHPTVHKNKSLLWAAPKTSIEIYLSNQFVTCKKVLKSCCELFYYESVHECRPGKKMPNYKRHVVGIGKPGRGMDGVKFGILPAHHLCTFWGLWSFFSDSVVYIIKTMLYIVGTQFDLICKYFVTIDSNSL